MRRILNHMGVGGLVVFALFGWTGLSLASVGAALLFIVAIASARSFSHALIRDPVAWLVAIAMLYLLGHFFLLSLLQPIEGGPDPGALQDWFVLWLFPVVAWALRDQSPAFVRFIFGLAAIGLVVPVIWHIQWGGLAGFFAQRQEYQISHVPMGLYSGIVIFGLFVFLGALMNASEKMGRWGRKSAIGLWAVALVLALTAFVTTQSRGGWLAFALAVFVVVVFLVVRRRKDVLAIVRQHRVPVIVALLVVLSFLWFSHGVVEQRMVHEAEVYQTLHTLDREEIPYTSVGRRLHMWIYAVDKWSERPFFGWGEGSARELLKQDPKLTRHPHFHNSYLQIAVELGLFGLMLFAGAFLLLFLRMVARFGVHGIPLDLFVFLTGTWVMILSWGLIDTRFSQSDGRFLFLMMLGITMAFGRGWIRDAGSHRHNG